MSSSIHSTFCVEFLVCAVFVYMFASFVVSSFKVFLCVTLFVYIFAPSGLLSKLSTDFSNTKPFMTFCVGHTRFHLIVLTEPITAKEMALSYKDQNPLKNTDSESSTMMPPPFEITKDIKQVKQAGSCYSKSQCESNKLRNSKSTRLFKFDDKKSEQNVNAIRALKESVIMRPSRKKSISTFTERTRVERTYFTPNTRKDDAVAQKRVVDRVTNNDLFQEMEKLENAIEHRLGLIPD